MHGVAAASLEIFCPTLASDTHSSWTTSAAGSNNVVGVCLTGYQGSPTRACLIDGTWDTIVNPCTRTECAGCTAHAQTSPVQDVMSDTAGVGNRWARGPGTHVEKQCPAQANSGNAVWTATYSGVLATGTCIAGYAGSATRLCNADATWATAQSSCTRTGRFAGEPARWRAPRNRRLLQNSHCRPMSLFECTSAFERTEILCLALANDNNAAWPQSTAGTATVVGTCVAGYQGSPTRACSITGVFGAISNACTSTCDAAAGRACARGCVGVRASLRT